MLLLVTNKRSLASHWILDSVTIVMFYAFDVVILYFIWVDQRNKGCFIFFIKCNDTVWKIKHSYEVNLLLFLLHSIFQKVTIASIAL